MNREQFIQQEQASHDCIDFKTIYVDMAGDLIAGLLLSQIVYWHLPDKRGRDKRRVNKKGRLWVVKAYAEWHEEIRISARQAQRALRILQDRGLVTAERHLFAGAPTMHIAIEWEPFCEAWEAELANRAKEADAITPIGESDYDESVESHRHQTCQSSYRDHSSESTSTDIPEDTVVSSVAKRPAPPSAQAQEPPAKRVTWRTEIISEAQEYLWAQFNRRRWHTRAELDLFAKTEKEVGIEVMMRAVRWAAVNGIAKIPSVCSAARKMWSETPAARASPPPPRQTREVRVVYSDGGTETMEIPI